MAKYEHYDRQGYAQLYSILLKNIQKVSVFYFPGEEK